MDLKRATALDPALGRPQFGTLEIGRDRRLINCCPHIASEIITLHRFDA